MLVFQGNSMYKERTQGFAHNYTITHIFMLMRVTRSDVWWHLEASFHMRENMSRSTDIVLRYCRRVAKPSWFLCAPKKILAVVPSCRQRYSVDLSIYSFRKPYKVIEMPRLSYLPARSLKSSWKFLHAFIRCEMKGCWRTAWGRSVANHVFSRGSEYCGLLLSFWFLNGSPSTLKLFMMLLIAVIADYLSKIALRQQLKPWMPNCLPYNSL